MKWIWCCWLMGMAWGAAGQLVDNARYKLFGSEVYFNVDFIAANQIQSITGEVSVKHELRKIKPMNVYIAYSFDKKREAGQIPGTYFNTNLRVDTALITYTYDNDGHLIRTWANDKNGFYAYENQYDRDGRKVEEAYYRADTEVKGKLLLIRKERFAYPPTSEGSSRMITLNSQGKPYKETTYRRDEHGQLLQLQERYMITNKKTTVTHTYDDYARIHQRIEESDLGSKLKYEQSYTYDEFGNVYAEVIRKNDEVATRKEYIYRGDMLLKAILTKEESTGSIRIVNFKYAYHP